MGGTDEGGRVVDWEEGSGAVEGEAAWGVHAAPAIGGLGGWRSGAEPRHGIADGRFEVGPCWGWRGWAGGDDRHFFCASKLQLFIFTFTN